MSTRKTPVGEILDELTAAQARHNRLPKWAQHEIELLTRRLGEANDKIAELTANDPTRVLLDVSGMGSPERYLPDDSRVRFLLAGDDVWRNFIDVSLDGDTLEIRGLDQLEIRPNVSNVITVTTRKRT